MPHPEIAVYYIIKTAKRKTAISRSHPPALAFSRAIRAAIILSFPYFFVHYRSLLPFSYLSLILFIPRNDILKSL
jgi:hypothetical protein